MKHNSDKLISTKDNLPIAIGGVGGSGTRLIVQIIQELGYHIGNDLNEAKDNLLFTLLFRRKNIFLDDFETIENSFDLLLKKLRGLTLSTDEIKFLNKLAKEDRHNFSASWLAERVTKAIDQSIQSQHKLIAWKEPNTHVFLRQLLKYNNNIKYIHVVRDGLDMAFSRNQNQLMLWGDCYLNKPVTQSVSNALKYWNATHNRLLTLKKQHPERIQIVLFDLICQNDKEELKKLYHFINIAPSKHQHEKINTLVKAPETLGRGNNQNTKQIDSYDLEQYHQIMQTIHDAVG